MIAVIATPVRLSTGVISGAAPAGNLLPGRFRATLRSIVIRYGAGGSLGRLRRWLHPVFMTIAAFLGVLLPGGLLYGIIDCIVSDAVVYGMRGRGK